MLNKNHAARLRRVAQKIDRALDASMQAGGELWPQELRPYGLKLQGANQILQGLSQEIAARLASSTVEPDPVETEVDPDQTDVEDFEGVEQPQPASRSRRRAA